MTLRTRLSLTIAGIALLLVLPAVYGVSQLRDLRLLAQEQRLRHGEAYIALGGLQSSLSELKRSTTEYTIEPSPVKRTDMLSALSSARDQIAKLGSAGYRLPARLASEHVNLLGVATRRIELLMEEDRREEATNQLETFKTLVAATDSATATIGVEIDRRSSADLDAASRISSTAATTALSALVLCLSLAIALGAWTTRALTRPIVQLRNAMAVVADGDFTVPRDLAFTRDDEIGSASRSFRAMTLQLADLDRLKAEFLSFATHELRTPLNVVSGYAELLLEGLYGDLAPTQIEALDAIRDQTRVIAELSNQLLDIGRLEAGGLSLETAEVRSAELAQRVQRAFEPIAHQKRIDLVVDIEPTMPDTVRIDADRICDQVLGNLLSNALKFTPEGGRVSVSFRGFDGGLAIEVVDTGPGIPADKLEHIFQRYYQVGDDARRKGAGLGLSIAHAVVRAHGGTIEAESESAGGTTFRVRLPLSAEQMDVAVIGASTVQPA